MLRPIVVLLLVLPVSAQELREFFDPAAREFRLPVIQRAEFNKLSKKQRLLARGFLRGGYFDPPQYKGSSPQAMNTRRTLFAGFSYRERLMDKQRSWLRAARHASLDDVLDLIELLSLPSPVEFTARYGPLTEGSDAAKRNPRQALLALRHSERQFRAWWVDETGRAVRAANRAGRLRAIRRLSGYLRHRDDAVRMASARMLGFLDDLEARTTTERGIARFEEPDLRAALIRARARQGGDDLPGKLNTWVDHVEPELSRAAIAALRDDRASWSLDVLQERIATAKARRFEDLEVAITARNNAVADFDGPVDFYGLKTKSKRIVFCIDVSISMDFPMDGRGGKREPRRTRTLRELTRTLERLPADVEFNVILFSQRITPLWRRLRPAEPKQRAAALEFVRRAGTEPGTDIWAAVAAALSSGADTAFLLGDGEPSVGRILDPALILHDATAANATQRLRIHAVGLSRDQNTELLYNLARASGGQFVADR
ncbi:MAG: vWA domain-containing protein [Planctomycetota bacterium]